MKRSFTIEIRSDEMAGDAQRRVPLHIIGGTRVKRSFTIEMRSDEMAGDAQRRVPLHIIGGYR